MLMDQICQYQKKPLFGSSSSSDKSVCWKDSWISSEAILPVAFQVLNDTQPLSPSGVDGFKIKLLAKTRYTTRVFLVFDISNTAYSPENGHQPQQNKLPVAIVSLSY